MNPVAVVFGKELKDAIRDRRTWIVVLATSMLAGPVLLLALSGFIAGIEESAARREVFVDNATAAPTLVNFMQRAGGNVKDAPANYRQQIKAGTLQNAVVIVPPDFEARLARGESIQIDVMFDETATKAQPSVRATLAILRGFNRELGTQRLLARGVSPHLLTPIEIQEHSLASSQARGAQLLFLVPWMALMAAMIGAISVAIDVTAGERERGSLEPLLMNPVSTATLVFGKWAVVALCSAAVVVLTLAGFKLAMQLIRSETLSALMQFGVAETGLFLIMLLPFSAMVAALIMLASTYGRSHKEAQTYASYITIFVNIAPFVSLFITERDAPWQLFVPALAQQSVMMRALRGGAVGALDILLPVAIALAATAAALLLQARLLRNERIIFSRSV